MARTKATQRIVERGEERLKKRNVKYTVRRPPPPPPSPTPPPTPEQNTYTFPQRIKKVAPMTPIEPPPPAAAVRKITPRPTFTPAGAPPAPPAPPEAATEPVDDDKLKPIYYFRPPPFQKGIIPEGKFEYGNNRVATIQSEWPYEKLVNPIRYDTGVRERDRCPRCMFIKDDGIQCRLRTCKTGPYCWTHTAKSSKLRVTNSKEEGAGQGLFAWGGVQVSAVGKVVFRAGEKIMNYQLRSEILTMAQNNRIYSLPPEPPNETPEERRIRLRSDLNVYGVKDRDMSKLVQTNTEFVIDTRASNSNVARYANDCRRPGNECEQIYNAEIVDGFIVATKDIYHGDEIIWSYGEQYWNEGAPVQEPVRRVKEGTG